MSLSVRQIFLVHPETETLPDNLNCAYFWVWGRSLHFFIIFLFYIVGFIILSVFFLREKPEE